MKASVVVCSSFVFFFFFIKIELATTLAIQITPSQHAHDHAATELISLYDEQDPVIELVDANITNVVSNDPGKVWFVEFYAHWCGHCQRFSPVWKALAQEFDGNKISRLNSPAAAKFNKT